MRWGKWEEKIHVKATVSESISPVENNNLRQSAKTPSDELLLILLQVSKFVHHHAYTIC